jgi:large subunit ribosomal protein L31e
MAKEKKPEKILERIYTIPLRPEWLKAPRYKRAKKAIRAIREFLVRHMKIYDRDLSKIKIDSWLNKAVWVRGIKNVPHKIVVKATKDSDGFVRVEFINLPKKFRQEDKELRRKIEKARKKEIEKAKKEKAKQEEKKALEKKVEEKETKTEEELINEKEEKEKEKILHKEIVKTKTDHIAETKHTRKEVHKTQTNR